MSNKIRVAFFPPTDSSWMGGVNYYKNLFFALNTHKKSEIELVLVVPKSSDSNIISIYSKYIDEIYYVSLLSKNEPLGFMSKIENRLFNTNYLIDFFLKRKRIDIVSHSYISNFKKVKSIGWIPDFQHLHLPEMFTNKEIENRNKDFKKLINKCDGIFLSSYDALKDFKEFSPCNIRKANVLHFVSQPEEEYFLLKEKEREKLIEKYNIPDMFFYLPNQFWKHKNHILAFKAIKHIRDRGGDAVLVCTGNLKDYRSPGHIKYLQEYIVENNLNDNIRMLGMVPYNDVFGLIKFSQAVINPSLFEGWSSTVEECKSVGKELIISNISVHKEQAPNALFFEKDNYESLSNILESFSKKKEFNFTDLGKRTRKYANDYESILRKILI